MSKTLQTDNDGSPESGAAGGGGVARLNGWPKILPHRPLIKTADILCVFQGFDKEAVGQKIGHSVSCDSPEPYAKP